MADKTCATCKYWGGIGTPLQSEVKPCTNMKILGVMQIEDGSSRKVWPLKTTEQFGCIFHEEPLDIIHELTHRVENWEKAMGYSEEIKQTKLKIQLDELKQRVAALEKLMEDDGR